MKVVPVFDRMISGVEKDKLSVKISSTSQVSEISEDLHFRKEEKSLMVSISLNVSVCPYSKYAEVPLHCLIILTIARYASFAALFALKYSKSFRSVATVMRGMIMTGLSEFEVSILIERFRMVDLICLVAIPISNVESLLDEPINDRIISLSSKSHN